MTGLRRLLGMLVVIAIAGIASPRVQAAVESFRLAAPGVSPQPIRVRVLAPPGYRRDATPGYPVLYLNDGQDLEAVGLEDTLARLYRERAIRPMLVVAIDMPKDRMAGYGLSDRDKGKAVIANTKYGPVGANAHAYSQWLVETLVPRIDHGWNTRPSAESRYLLGWSLGAINAFSVGWQYPEVFGKVGAFSPSFWLSARNDDAKAVQGSRIAHALVDGSDWQPRPRFFFAVGMAEETDDRDGDGMVDVLDDTLDLMQGWRDAAGKARKGLRQLGYALNTDYAVHPDRAPAVLYRLPAGEHNQRSWARMLPAFLRWADGVHAPPINATGTLDSWQDFPSRHVSVRTIDVWLPPGYASDQPRCYPVVYMHDGQNLFDPDQVFNNTDWDVDGAMTRGIARGQLPPAIIVGIGNSPTRRFQEYMPAIVPQGERVETGVAGRPGFASTDIRSEAYLHFLVDELKPFIDRHYRTRPGRADTFVMGSSMGGLVSLYAIAKHPQLFGGAAAVSTHWPAGGGVMVDWFAGHLPPPASHRIWMDHGDGTLDAAYAPYQKWMDAAMQQGGYREGANWQSRVYPGTEHSEVAWRARLPEILAFLLQDRAD